MHSDHPTVSFYNRDDRDFDDRHFAYRTGQLILQGPVDDEARQILADGQGLDLEDLPEELIRNPETDAIDVGGVPYSLIRTIAPGAVIPIAKERPDRFQPNHVFFAQQQLAWPSDEDCCPHFSQRDYQGATHALTADWVTPLPVTTALNTAGQPSYSAMRAAPLHMNPLHMNPLHMNPLHMNPLLANPLHMNPLHMNAYISNAIPVERDRQKGPVEPAATAGEGVYVHIIDSGLGLSPQFDSVFLKAHVPPVAGDAVDKPDRINAWNPFTNGDGFIDPVASHGTFIAGIYAQLLPKAEIHVDAAIDPDGLLDEWSAGFQTIEMLLKDKPGGVLNLSFAGTVSDFSNGTTFLLMHEIIKLVVASNYVVVGSAGNVSSCEHYFPAAFPEVIGVGALDADGVAWFSNFGSWVNCYAPGVDLISTFLPCDGTLRPFFDVCPDAQMTGQFQAPWVGGAAVKFDGFTDLDNFMGGWAAWSGTSFAAPIVGARAAELLGKGKTLDEIRTDVETKFALTPIPIPIPT